MSFRAWVNSKAKNLSWLDIKLTQLSAVGIALMIAKLWQPLLSLDWYWYAAIFVLAAIKPAYNVLKK